MKRKDRALNILAWCYRQLNRILPWYRLPKILGIGNLVALRHDLRRWNLFDTGPLMAGHGTRHCPFHRKDLDERRADGSHNDLQLPLWAALVVPLVEMLHSRPSRRLPNRVSKHRAPAPSAGCL